MSLNNKLTIAQSDTEVWEAMSQENTRQEMHIELIASENYASKAVLEAVGSQLTNKYAEGYPGKRYYGGCEHVDVVELIAIERAKKFLMRLTLMYSRTLVPSERCGLSGISRARCYRIGNESLRWRAFDPRLACKLFWENL